MKNLLNFYYTYNNDFIGARVRTYLMGKMMEAVVAETMQFGTAEHEEDLYSPYAHIAASEFKRQPFAHHEEYVASLTANTRRLNYEIYGMHHLDINV